jgi:antitoxin ParD1/3/4
MSYTEQLTVTLPADVAVAARSVVQSGDYASAGDVVREALAEWTAKHIRKTSDLQSLRADIGVGLTDLAEGRVRDFDAGRIIERGRQSRRLHSD